MGMDYLEAQKGNMYALQNMGSTFSDAVIGMAEAKSKRQQIANQMMMDQAYYRLAQQKEARDAQVSGAQIGHLGAETSLLGTQNLTAQAALTQGQRIARMRAQSQLGGPDLQSILSDPQAGGQMMEDLRGSGVAPQGRFQTSQQDLNGRLLAALSGQLYGNASMSPGGAEALSRPLMTMPGQIGRDPLNPSSVLFNNPYVMSPYQQGRIDYMNDRNEESTRFHDMLGTKWDDQNQLGYDNLNAKESYWDKKNDTSSRAVDERVTHDRNTEAGKVNPLRQRLLDLQNKGKTNSSPAQSSQGFTLMMNKDKQIVKVPNGATVPDGYTPIQ